MAAHKGNNYVLKRKWHPQYTEKQIDKLCEELIDFAENHKSIHFAKFCRKKKFTRQWLLETCKTHPELAHAYAEAKELMAAKILDLCFYDKESGVNANFGKDNLFRYDNDWNEHDKWKAEIAKEPVSEDKSKSAVLEYLKQQAEK